MPRLKFRLLPALPNFQFDLAITIDQFEILPICSDETGAMRASGESDENVGMKVAQFSRRKAVIGTNTEEYLARFQPILLRRSQDRVVSRQSRKKPAIRRGCGPPP